jgi:hypothetical protein
MGRLISKIKKGLDSTKKIIGAIMDPRRTSTCPSCRREVLYHRSIHAEDGSSEFFYKCICGTAFTREYSKMGSGTIIHSRINEGKTTKSSAPPVKTRPQHVSSVQEKYIYPRDIEKRMLTCPQCKKSHCTEVLGNLQSGTVPCYDCWRVLASSKAILAKHKTPII